MTLPHQGLDALREVAKARPEHGGGGESQRQRDAPAVATDGPDGRSRAGGGPCTTGPTTPAQQPRGAPEAEKWRAASHRSQAVPRHERSDGCGQYLGRREGDFRTALEMSEQAWRVLGAVVHLRELPEGGRGAAWAVCREEDTRLAVQPYTDTWHPETPQPNKRMRNNDNDRLQIRTSATDRERGRP